MSTALHMLSGSYLLLLQQPMPIRLHLQSTLSNLRDTIAEIGGFDLDEVQNAHELVAACAEERT